jgi:hypothetical protein
MPKLNLFSTITFCFLSILSAHGQIAIDNTSDLPRLKKSTTYIVMPDTASAVSQPYKAIFQQYWTYTPIAFIEYKDIYEHLGPEASFFTLGNYTTTSTFVRVNDKGVRRKGGSYSNTHLYYELWVCDPKNLSKWQNRKKKTEEMPDKVKRIIGRVELYTDYLTLLWPENIYKSDYDGGGHIYNWGPGYLKNYLQSLMALLEAGQERSLYKSELNPQQLRNLKKQTLYVPDYVLVKFKKFSGDESTRHEESDIFKSYKLPYELVSTNALSQKIIDSTEPFYHLVYIKSSTDKYVSVYDSQTGELVYTSYTPISYNIKDDDIEKLAKAVRGE